MTRHTTRASKNSYAGPPRCAIYARVSDPKQERDGTSLTTQEDACRAYARERGYIVAAVNTDVHTGRDIFERPGLSAIRAAVRSREVDVVVAHALDRLSRDQNYLGLSFSECDYKDDRVELVTENIGKSPRFCTSPPSPSPPQSAA